MDATTPKPAEPAVLIGADGMPIDNWHALTWYERVKALARGKQKYEVLYPETRHGGTRTAGTTRGGPSPFVVYAAELLGVNRDTISKHARIGASLIDLPEALKDHPLVNNLGELESLSKQPSDGQQAIVEKLLSGEVKTVKEALPQNNRRRANHQQTQSCGPFHSNGNETLKPLPARIAWIVDKVCEVQSQSNVTNAVAQHLRDAEHSLQEALQAQEAEAESWPKHHEFRPFLPPIPRDNGYQPSSFPVGGAVSSQRLSEEGCSPRGNTA